MPSIRPITKEIPGFPSPQTVLKQQKVKIQAGLAETKTQVGTPIDDLKDVTVVPLAQTAVNVGKQIVRKLQSAQEKLGNFIFKADVETARRNAAKEDAKAWKQLLSEEEAKFTARESFTKADNARIETESGEFKAQAQSQKDLAHIFRQEQLEELVLLDGLKKQQTALEAQLAAVKKEIKTKEVATKELNEVANGLTKDVNLL